MKKFKDLNLEKVQNYENFTEPGMDIEETVNETIPEYMLQDPQYVGYPSEEFQDLIYNTSLISTVNSLTETVLDVGCGRGDFGNYILNATPYKQIKYKGIDVNEIHINVGKQKYQNLLNKDSNNFDLEVQNFDENFTSDIKYDWIFHIFNTVNDYGLKNEKTDNEYLEMLIRKSLQYSKLGVVFYILNQNSSESNIVYNFNDITEILFKYNVRFAIDNTDNKNISKIIILNNYF
jgi:SAM-dependent methyltransferase